MTKENQTVLEGQQFEKYWSAGILYGSNPLTHPLPSLPILCHIPSHKLTHLLVGIKTPFAGFLSALVGCHRSCYSFRSSEVACSVCLPPLHFAFWQLKKQICSNTSCLCEFFTFTLWQPCLRCSRT